MIILNTKSIINKLYHISDIHIRRYDRHAEYEIVFNNLYTFLNSVKSINDKDSLNNQLIIITGDILHAKDNLTPDCVVKCYKFLKTLADIMPVILIAGNHDMVETNKTIKDSIDAILSERNIDNLYYLKHSGIYKYGNIIFGASSLLDNQFIKASDILTHNEYQEDNILVGLYHGPVGACSTAVGVVLHGDKQINDFIGYNYVLLGDIHKFQYMNNNNFNNTIAYASSLISQNFAETDDYHGVLIWDLINKTSDYHIIDNPYRYMKIDIINGNMIYNNNIFPTHAKIRLNITDTSKEICDNIKKTIKKKYPYITFQEIFQGKNINNNENIDTINEFNYTEMIKEYLINLNREDNEECQKIFMKDLEGMNLKMERQLCQWEFIDLEFSNLFVYGENNKIDFTKLPMNDIVGLFAPNSYGKSSFIDIILFSLYDNFSRNAVNKHRTIPSYIVNNNFNWFESKIRFKLGNDIYCIHKKGTLKGKAKSKTGKAISFDIYNFSCYSNTDTIVNLTRKDRFETLEEISKIIGSYDDFCLTSLFLQNKERNFYEMSSTDRKSFLYNMFNLDKFESMHDSYKNEEKMYKTLKDDIEGKIIGFDIDTILECILKDKKKIKLINKKIEELYVIKRTIEKKKQKIIYLLNNDIMNNFDNSLNINDLDRLKINYNVCDFIINNYINYESKDNSYYINLFSNMHDSININNTNNTIDIKKIKENHHFLLNEQTVLEHYEIYKCQMEKKERIQYKLNVISDYINSTSINNVINEDCYVCIKRKNILNKYIEEKKALDIELNKIDLNNEYKLDYDKLLLIKLEQEVLLNDYNSYKKDLCKCILDILKTKHVYICDINKFINYRNYLNINIECLMNIENIKLIKKYDTKINIIDEKLNYYNNLIHNYKYNLGINETKYNEYNQMKNDIKIIIQKYNIYSCLKKISHINGIPSKIISLQLHTIENMLNTIISPFINKKIEINLDGNLIIVNIIDDQSNIINILGGMEMFIINIGFKISLSSLSLLPKNKLLIIDEGVSVLDKKHIEQFDKIILFLNQHYENIILISHIDSLKDFISHYMHITKQINSCINY